MTRFATFLGRTALRTLGWLPPIVALVVLGQLYVKGWLPAVQEKERLDRAEVEVTARRHALGEEREAYRLDEARVVDPMWHARVEKSLERKGEPLHLPSLARTSER